MEFVSVGISFVALLVSGIAVVLDRRNARRLTEIEEGRRREELERAASAQLEPAVVHHDRSIYLRVANIGAATATTISIHAKAALRDIELVEEDLIPPVLIGGAIIYIPMTEVSFTGAYQHVFGQIEVVIGWEDETSAKHGRASQQRRLMPVPWH